MTDQTPLTDQQLAEIEAKIATYRQHAPTGFACCTAHPVADAGAALLAEVRRLQSESSAVEQLKRAFVAELDDERALTLLDALTVLRSKLPCTCARSQGLHETGCRRYVAGHDLLSPARRLKRARQEMSPDAPRRAAASV